MYVCSHTNCVLGLWQRYLQEPLQLAKLGGTCMHKCTHTQTHPYTPPSTPTHTLHTHNMETHLRHPLSAAAAAVVQHGTAADQPNGPPGLEVRAPFCAPTLRQLWPWRPFPVPPGAWPTTALGSSAEPAQARIKHAKCTHVSLRTHVSLHSLSLHTRIKRAKCTQ